VGWQLICKYSTLKNWSIQGGLSTSSLFGLSGNLQVQLTFEKYFIVETSDFVDYFKAYE
jgi:hypothetical protein